MRIIIAGSRSINDMSVVENAIKDSEFQITEVVCGMARGVDRLGAMWARRYAIPVAKFPANWDRWGRGAGFIRNQKMAEYSDGLIAIWDGKSKGTNDMIHRMMHLEKPVWISKSTT